MIPLLFFGNIHVSALEKEDRLWQDETVYYIMIDRFLNGDSDNDYDVNPQDLNAYNGGDFQGIIEKLDYIKDMGFTTIALSPIFENEENSYQGDLVTNFYKIEEHFGSLQEFKTLVKEAHEKDLKVMIEFVADEVAPSHEWTKDSSKEAYFILGSTRLNLENNEARNDLVDVGKWWIEETDIDGYYLSDVNKLPTTFWSDFSQAMKDVKKDFFLFGTMAEGDMTPFLSAGFDGIMSREQIESLSMAFEQVDSKISGNILEVAEQGMQFLEEGKHLGMALDDKQSARFTEGIVNLKQNPATRWKLALAYTYTTPSIPVVFYGSEIAIAGSKTPENHRLMGFRAEEELINHITTLGRLRQELPALTRGNFDLLHEEDGLVVYKRSYKDEVIVVAINNSAKTQQVTLTNDSLGKEKELRGLFAGDLSREDDNGEYQIVIDREEVEIYALVDKTTIKISYIAAIAMVWVLFALFIYLVMKRSKRNASSKN